jgi:deoxyribose-phosphate aldolase
VKASVLPKPAAAHPKAAAAAAVADAKDLHIKPDPCRAFALPFIRRDYMQSIASKIDHTLLKPDATPAQIESLCKEALSFGTASVCVNPIYVPLCHRLLANSSVKVCTVVGFPLGASTSKSKAFEAAEAVSLGASEIDMVISVASAKAGDKNALIDDIKAVVEASSEAIVKVILEVCLLTDAEKVLVCEAALEAGAHFVKTSTGFSTGGATVADVALFRSVVGDKMQIKAAGGIRTYDNALAMLSAGADRLGASATALILAEESRRAGRI